MKCVENFVKQNCGAAAVPESGFYDNSAKKIDFKRDTLIRTRTVVRGVRKTRAVQPDACLVSSRALFSEGSGTEEGNDFDDEQ